jgi:hypothetical protein
MKKDDLTYYIPNETKYKTNLKNYESLKNGYTFYADFQLNKFIENEACIIGRQDLHYMGLFLQNPNALKFVWHKKGGVYTDIFLEIGDVYEPMNVLVTISDHIKVYKNGILLGVKESGDMIDYSDKNILIGSINPHFESWELKFDGVINEVKIFDRVVINQDNTENLFTHLDFKNQSRFKTFDISGNGNHGLIYENPVFRDSKINEYVSVGPKQKIL